MNSVDSFMKFQETQYMERKKNSSSSAIRSNVVKNLSYLQNLYTGENEILMSLDDISSDEIDQAYTPNLKKIIVERPQKLTDLQRLRIRAHQIPLVHANRTLVKTAPVNATRKESPVKSPYYNTIYKNLQKTRQDASIYVQEIVKAQTLKLQRK